MNSARIKVQERYSKMRSKPDFGMTALVSRYHYFPERRTISLALFLEYGWATLSEKVKTLQTDSFRI